VSKAIGPDFKGLATARHRRDRLRASRWVERAADPSPAKEVWPDREGAPTSRARSRLFNTEALILTVRGADVVRAHAMSGGVSVSTGTQGTG
jgi:hypothetical protein